MVIGCLARFQLEPFFGVDRRELVERFDLDVVVRHDAVDVEDFLEARALAAAMALHHAGDEHALAEAELLDHRAGHEGIGPLAGEVGCRVAEEAVAVGVHFEHAGAGHERQRLAVFVDFDVVAILAIGRGP